MRITRLLAATVTAPSFHPRPDATIPIYVYLLPMPHGMLLFDTGLGPSHELIDALYTPQCRDLHALVEADGVAVEDVRTIVNCHLHFDHCGGNQFFPRAQILVQCAELEASREPMYTVPEWVAFDGADLVVVEGEHVVCDGVRLVPTPGHTVGHQSLVVDTADGVVVLAGQASESAADFEDEDVGGWDPELVAEGLATCDH